VTAWLVGRQFQRSSEDFALHADELRTRIDDPRRAEVVVLRAMGGAFFLPFALDPHGEMPARWRILAQTGHVLALRRDERTLELVAPRGQSLFPTGEGNLFRSPAAKLAAGDVFTTPGMRITVVEVGAAGPRIARFEFERALEDAPLTWITETFGGFPEAALPQPGFGKPLDP
jgi:hypothetical protein